MANPTQLDRMEAMLVDIRSLVRTTLAQELQMANVLDPIATAIPALITAVTNETTVDQSAITLLNGLSAQIAALATNAADPAQVSSIASQLSTLATTMQGNIGALAAAVTANTPAAPAPSTPAA